MDLSGTVDQYCLSDH